MDEQEINELLNRLTKEAEEGQYDVSVLERIQPLMDQYMLVRLKIQQLTAKKATIYKFTPKWILFSFIIFVY